MEKELSTRMQNKLKNLSFDDKVKLFARLCIMRQNKEVSGLIINNLHVNTHDYEDMKFLNDFKAEITHHLFDGNDQYNYSRNFSRLLNIMKNGENAFDKFDTYTLCAFMCYFQKFIKFAENATSISEFREAKERAAAITLEFCSRNAFGFDDADTKFGSLLDKEHRKEVVDILVNDLKIKNGYKFAADYMNGAFEYDEEEYEQYIDPNKVYANQVDTYYDENNVAYYLDPEGNKYDADQVEDYITNGIVMRATEHGIEEFHNNEQTR